METKSLRPRRPHTGNPLVGGDLHKQYGDKVVLEGANASINPGDRIGLVGRNGCGKSTLIRILAGVELPGRGQVVGPGLKIGYLPQDLTLEKAATLFDVATEGIQDTVQALDTFEQMTANWDAEDPRTAKEYDGLLDYLESQGGFRLQTRLVRVLTGLGICYPLDTPVSRLSGGETIRLALARILMLDPDILLLDEPTNHLDINANLWLREFLGTWTGGLLVASHDRDFLDEVTACTWELEDGRIAVYGGSYSFYKEQKGIEQEVREREAIRLESEVRKARRQVQKEQQRAAHSARRDLSRKPEDHDHLQARYFKDRATRTAGTKRRVALQRRDELAERLDAARKGKTPIIRPQIIESDAHSGRLLVRAHNLNIGYGAAAIITAASLRLHFGDRVAVFGNNGSGKTTLVKGIMGHSDVRVEGELEVAAAINIQLLDQRYGIVDREKTVLENMLDAAPSAPEAEIRKHLARFLFAETAEVDKRASVLSGGEIARLALAVMTAMPIDLLILDEPTNNLDTTSIEEIEAVLREFLGAILVISHDLSFLRRIGVDTCYVISQGVVHTLMYNPGDGDEFKEELLSFLQV